MGMQTIVKAADPVDLLSVVPVLTGYLPSESVVFVLFEGTLSCGVVRCDLPRPDDDVGRTAATLIGFACKTPTVDGIAIVVYTDAAYERDGDVCHTALVDALRSRADACGLEIKAALCSARDAWGSYLDDRRRRSHDEVERRADTSPLPRPPSASSQATGAELPPFDLACRERVARALHRLREAQAVLLGGDAAGGATPVDSHALAAACALDDPAEHFEDALRWDPSRLNPYAAATMLWCLDRPILRDVAVAQWCRDQATGDETLAAQLDWHEGAEIPHRLAQHFWGDGPAPDFGRLERALALTKALASLAPRNVKAGALATVAWLSWALGRSTHACVHAMEALALDDEHTLAAIVMALASAGRVPEWAFRRRSDGC